VIRDKGTLQYKIYMGNGEKCSRAGHCTIGSLYNSVLSKQSCHLWLYSLCVFEQFLIIWISSFTVIKSIPAEIVFKRHELVIGEKQVVKSSGTEN